MTNNILKIITEIIVAIAAPLIPNELSKPKIKGIGTSQILRTILIILAMTISIRMIFDLPIIERRLFEIINIDENKVPIRRNLNAVVATRYSAPKSILIITPGKKIIKRKNGKFMMKIHFAICFVISLINLNFLREYSLVISGKRSWIKISGAKLRSRAIGITAL